MNLEFLGTGAGLPSKHRNVTSYVLDLLQERGEMWMVDCGEGTQKQILESTIKPTKIGKIFITHLHGDHIYGLLGLLSTINVQGRTEELEILAPKGLKEWVLATYKMTKTYLNYKIKFTEVSNGSHFDFDDFTVDVLLLDHDVDSFGFRITQKDLDGVLDVEKAKELGVPFGKEMGVLKRGGDVTLADGTVVKSSDVVGEKRKGKVITVFGDTKYHDYFIDFAKDSDVLVYEGTVNPSDNEKMAGKHSTYLQAGQLAKKANVKQLLINHISSRYLPAELKIMSKTVKKIHEKTVLTYDFYKHEF